MKTQTDIDKILSPRNQLFLYGYDKYFQLFIKLFKEKKLPSTILLNGQKGLGKATFAYHYINYLLSHNETDKYSLSEFRINPINKSFNLINNDIHPNFYLIDNNLFDDKIKIEKIRNSIKYLHKSTYSSNLKILLLDNAEKLNVQSANALLKVLEEPPENTFFFIIHNSSSKILDTIKSRSIEFKFFFDISEKKNILKNIIEQYNYDFDLNNFNENFYLDSPGNILKYFHLLEEPDVNIFDNKLACINKLVDKYKQKNDTELLNFISFFVELYYKELCNNNISNFDKYFYEKSLILNKINDVKNFNLDKKNLFVSISKTLGKNA